jgi:hypothetical protein
VVNPSGIEDPDRSAFGDTFRVTGLFRGGTTITNSIAFISGDDFAARRGDAVSYVMVGSRPGVDADELAGARQRHPRDLSGGGLSRDPALLHLPLPSRQSGRPPITSFWSQTGR